MSKAASRLLISQSPQGARALACSVRSEMGLGFERCTSALTGPQIPADLSRKAEPRDGLPRDAGPSQFEVELISDPRRLEELESDWHTLWSALEDSTPFQSPDWILPWWRHYGQGQLLTFAFWRNHQLAGLAPMYVYEDGADPVRRIFLLGTGNTDYLDVIIHPELRRQCWETLVSEIWQRRALWDECDFQRLRPACLLLQQLEPSSDLMETSIEQEPCVVIDFCDENPAESMLKTSTFYGRKLASKEPYTIEQVSPTSLNEFLCAFEQLHERRWNAKGFSGVLAEDRDRSFHREVASRFLEAGSLMLYALRVHEEIVSVIYGFHHRDRTYSYLSGFDPEYRRQSVGTILIGYAIQQSLQQHRSFDFLKGQEPYKYRWGARDEVVLGRRIKKAE